MLPPNATPALRGKNELTPCVLDDIGNAGDAVNSQHVPHCLVYKGTPKKEARQVASFPDPHFVRLPEVSLGFVSPRSRERAHWEPNSKGS